MVRKQNGFSLIELMVVVTIIGILASIAVPNLQRMMYKARQSEAKGNLSNLHTSMQNFHAEWNFYRGDFRDIGYNLTGDLRYIIGFGNAGGPSPANWPRNFVPNTLGAPAGACHLSNAVPGVCFPEVTHTLTNGVWWNGLNGGTCLQGQSPSTGFGSASSYVATAAGNSSTGGVSGLDVWTMSHLAMLCNNRPGSP